MAYAEIEGKKTGVWICRTHMTLQATNESCHQCKKELTMQDQFQEKVTVPQVPQIGSVWFNNRRQKNYTIYGVVAHCDGEDDWEVLYRSDDMPEGQFRRRSVADWYGTNRYGDPRFVQVKDAGKLTPL